jgi:hypothetical protein
MLPEVGVSFILGVPVFWQAKNVAAKIAVSTNTANNCLFIKYLFIIPAFCQHSMGHNINKYLFLSLMFSLQFSPERLFLFITKRVPLISDRERWALP